MVDRRVVRFSAPALSELEWPVFEATGSRDGPRLCLLAGVHGCEYPAIAAVVRFMRELDTSGLAGSIVAVPIVSPSSYVARSPFVVPEDGRNLNRSFPGDPDGSFSQVLAHHVFTEFISPSDLLIDLHGGDMVEALEPFALYDNSPQRETADRLARAFGFGYVVCDSTEALGGTTSGAAAAAGIAAVTGRGRSARPGTGQRAASGQHAPRRARPAPRRAATRRAVRVAALRRAGLVASRGRGRRSRRRG